jgi:molybdenum cofactor cytidylyltransferase
MAAARRSSRTRPGLSPRTDEFVCRFVLAAGGSSRLGRPKQLLAYEDGRGHPLAFARSVFGALESLHGDKGVWKLLDRRADDVVEVPVAGRIPRDMDTVEDYEAVLRS